MYKRQIERLWEQNEDRRTREFDVLESRLTHHEVAGSPGEWSILIHVEGPRHALGEQHLHHAICDA